MPLFVERNLLGQLGNEMRTFRPRAHEAHLTLEDVPELRNLVDANLTNDATDARRARIALARPHRTTLLGVNSHRAKLHQHKSSPVLSDSFLLVKDRATRLQLDQHSSEQN